MLMVAQSLSQHWIASGNLLPLLLRGLWNRCTFAFRPVLPLVRYSRRKESNSPWMNLLSVDFRCSVNDVRSSYGCPFHHVRIYAEKTWWTAQLLIFRRRYLVQDFTDRGENSGFGYPRWYASILLQRDLISHHSITLIQLSISVQNQ